MKPGVGVSGADATGAHAALEKLGRTYWPPLYAFARRSGLARDAAKDAVPGFLARVLQREDIARATPERGRFRASLVTSFKNFLASEARAEKAVKRGSVDAGGAASFYHYDLTGNTQLLTGATGAAVGAYEYLPFGEKVGATGAAPNDFTFNGRYGVKENGAGLYDMHARAYDPALGRFLQKDPAGLLGGDTNLYRFTRNAPIDHVDPERVRRLLPGPPI